MGRKLILISLTVLGAVGLIAMIVFSLPGLYILYSAKYLVLEQLRTDINECFAKSNNGSHIYTYYGSKINKTYEEIVGADAKTFKPVEDSCYANDPYHSYFKRNLLGGDGRDDGDVELVNGSVKRIGQYAKTKYFVFYDGKIVRGADAETFGYSKVGEFELVMDKNALYYEGDYVGSVDTATLQQYVMGSSYLRDNDSAYYLQLTNSHRIVRLVGVNPNLLTVEPSDLEYATAGEEIYFKGEQVKWR